MGRLKANPNKKVVEEAKQFLSEIERHRLTPTVPTFEQQNITKLNFVVRTGDKEKITNAFLEATINNAKSREKTEKQPVYLRWLTSEKCRKRKYCCELHGCVISQQNAFQSISARTKGCQCGFALVPTISNTEKRQKLFDRERKKMIGNL